MLARLLSPEWRTVRVAALAFAGFGLVALLSFGPLVRRAAHAIGERRGIEIDAKRARPGWFRIVLSEVEVHPEGIPELRVELSEIGVGFDVLLRPRAVSIMGGRAVAEGALADLEGKVEAWRARHRAKAGETSSRKKSVLPVTGDALSIAWDGGPDAVQGSGISFTRDENGVQVAATELHAKHDDRVVELADLVVRLSKQGTLAEVRAKSAALDLGAPAPDKSATKPTNGSSEPPAPTAPNQAPSTAGAADEPLVPLPNLFALRARMGLFGKALREHSEPDAAVRVEGLSFRWGREPNRLTLGPGPFSLVRQQDRLVVEFATGRPAPGAPPGTALTMQGELPLGAGDAQVSFAGGPLGLAALGIKEGAVGLTDVGRGTLSGKGSLTLASDALAFDVDVSAKGLSMADKRLAEDVVRGLAVGARARGVLTDKGNLRVDDAEATLGALRLGLRGTLEQSGSQVTGAFSFATPVAPCQSLFDSIPRALLPSLDGAVMKGSFGGKGKLQFDSRKLDDLVLDYDFDNQCKLVQVPPELDKRRFSKAFFHRVYLTVGTVGEEETGPGTPAWTDLGAISPYMQVAVITTEDAAFYRHRGFNHRAIRESVIANLKTRKFVRGASTITMQLAKNLFLSREKTVSRKFEEVILTSYLEQSFSKQEIMELYFNVVEFGPDLYGIGRAAEHYFGRRPDELHLGEAFFLASLLPRPLAYHKTYERGALTDSWNRTLRFLMETAFKRGNISRGELNEGVSETVVFYKPDMPRPVPRPPVLGSRLFEQSIQK